MLRNTILTLMTSLMLACSSSSGGAGSAQPVVVDLEDPAAPFMTIGEDGTVIVFRTDPVSGAPTGLTMMLEDGQSGELAIDPATGLPAYWTSAGYVIVYSNIRPSEGLADIGIITPDGTSAEELDVAFTPIELSAPPATFNLALRTPEEMRAKFNQTVSAFDAAINLTTCINGAILTTASIAGVAVPVVGIPLFTATAGATAAVCAAALVQVMALDPNNATFAAINDGLGAAGVPSSVAQCLTKPGVLRCLRTAADLTSLAASSLVGALSATFLRLRDGEAKDVPYQVYCCNGPTQVARGDSERWRAVVVEGLGKTPFTYKFDPGDGTPETWLNSNLYGLNFDHTYETAGTHTMEVSVRDQTGSQVDSNATVTGPLTSFQVRVYNPLSAVQCCTIFAGDLTAEGLYAGDEVVFSFDVADGKRPYAYSMDFGDGNAPVTGEFAADLTHVTHVFAEPGSFEVVVTVTDADGDSVTSVPTSVTIENKPASELFSPECMDAKLHLCTNIRGQQCSTSTMGNAVGKVSAACGAGEASRFASVAETYCVVTGLGSFTTQTCAEQ